MARGIYVVKAFEGRGLLTAAFAVARSFAVDALNLRHFMSGAFVENEASGHVHRKLGFTSSGTGWLEVPPERVAMNGKRVEVEVFEWRA